VYAGFHVLTGEEVAIKSEMPAKTDDICVIPYEAQVYCHLHGYYGIPMLRWIGTPCHGTGQIGPKSPRASPGMQRSALFENNYDGC
jgi:hypothetical protein